MTYYLAGVSQEISSFLYGQRGRLAGAALPPGVLRANGIERLVTGGDDLRPATLLVRVRLMPPSPPVWPPTVPADGRLSAT
jgi:hypothetical protein